MRPDPASRNNKEPHTLAATAIEFLEECGQIVDLKQAEQGLRATPQGIFVTKELLPHFVKYYQEWLSKKTQGKAEAGDQKCLKRLFGTLTPSQFYLVEAKHCLVGHLIAHSFPQPQHLGLPYYLGSVDDAEGALHPRDPLFLCMPNLELRQSAQGIEYVLTREEGSVIIPSDLVKSLLRVLRSSPRLGRKFPEGRSALRDAFKVLLDTLLHAHWAKDTDRLLVPTETHSSKGLRYLTRGLVTFVCDKKGLVLGSYGIENKNLHFFIREELASLGAVLRGKPRGSFEIFRPTHKHLGQFHIYGKFFELNPMALEDFVRAALEEPAGEKTSAKRFTVIDCLDEFSELFLKTDPIERNKILRHVEHLKINQAKFRIFERWIFVLGRGDVVLACLDRFHAPGGRR